MNKLKPCMMIVMTFLIFSNVLTLLAHGGDLTLIHSCVRNNPPRTLRIISANDTCNSNETPLDWGIQGEPGLSCWDLNSNSVKDPEEDINGDSVFDALDCKGEPADSPLDIGARVYSSVNIPTNPIVTNILTFDSERWDTNNIYTSTNPSRLTANIAGKYYIWGGVRFQGDNNGTRVVGILLNGNTAIAVHDEPSSTPLDFSMDVSTVYHLEAGDYVELYIVQSSGSLLNVLTAPNYSPEFAMQRFN
jgi:hypothetical protein